MILKKNTSKPTRLIYANWPEGYVNQRFIEALNRKFEVRTFNFDETGTEIIRVRYPPIVIPPSIKRFTIKDPPLLNIPLNIKVATKGGSAGWVLKTFLRALLFRRYIKRLEPDLLVGNGVSGTNPYGFCCALSGFHPFVILVWGSDILIEAKKSILLRFIAKFVLKKADGVIVDSEIKRQAAIALGCLKEKIWKFPWGIDLSMFPPHVGGSYVKTHLGWANNKIIISTRNHFPIYGVEYLIKAIPIVIKRYPEARFLIIGEGTDTKKLKNMTEEAHIESYVLFVGKVPNTDLSKYLNAADIYVSTSLSDGTSNSLLESLACSLPVVVTDIPGNREWIENGKNGFLVPIKDPTKIAEKIVFLLENDELRELLGTNNAKLANEKADWKKNVNLLYQCVTTLTAKSS
jgi:L-malate glycosyltransferase